MPPVFHEWDGAMNETTTMNPIVTDFLNSIDTSS
jgi:hypothetical protein